MIEKMKTKNMDEVKFSYRRQIKRFISDVILLKNKMNQEEQIGGKANSDQILNTILTNQILEVLAYVRQQRTGKTFGFKLK